MKRTALAAVALLLVAGDAGAQVAVGDSLWQAGKLDEAAAAYLRAVEMDRNSVRANFRIAQTLAWGNNIDSALVFLHNARERVPDDPDLRFAEATYLSWGRRFDEAMARYDSILAGAPGPDFAYVRVARARTLSWAGRLEDAAAGYREALNLVPGDRDASFGLAQIEAWSGNLARAADAYEALLADDPTETRTLVAMAQVRLWQGRPGAAADMLEQVVAADTVQTDYVMIRRAVRGALGTSVGLTTSWSEDRDGNANAWQVVTAQAVVGEATRVTLSAGYLDASDPIRTADRTLAEIALSRPLGRGTVSAGLGVRNLGPAPLNAGDPRPAGRAVATGRLSVSQRVGGGLTLGAGVSRWPFDEIAALMVLELDVDQLDLTADWRVTPKVTVSGALTRLSFSDGNTRMTWSGRLNRRLSHGFQAGLFGTAFGYDFKAPRYFSPPSFRSGELNGGWGRETERWTAFLGGGFGAQKVDTAAVQSQWHVDGRASLRLGSSWWLEASGGRSTSAAATAVGAYRYEVLTLGVRRKF